MSQNKGAGYDPAGYQLITKSSMLGYLKPLNSPTPPKPEPEVDMTVSEH